MSTMVDKYALTALVTLVAVMFATYFAGYILVPHVAIALFTIIGIAYVFEQYQNQYVEVV